MSRLERLFRPRSVALIGGTEAEEVARQLDLFDFTGDVWCVHPTRTEMAGRIVHRHVSALPSAPDAAFVGVPREVATDVVRDLAAMGSGGAVVYPSGFGEAGERDRESELIGAAGEMPLLGPNTYGYVNALDGTLIWPDVHGLRRVDSGVGVITQSGNIGINLTMARRSVDIAFVVTAGNQAAVAIPEIMDTYLHDERISALGVQLESITDPVSFGEACLRAQRLGKPIVVLKMGATERGGLLTKSHTGALITADDEYQALFDYYGVARVRSIPAFLEALKLAGHVERSPRVLSLSASGGEAAHVADLAAIAGVDLPELTPEGIGRVMETTHPLVSISNPMDYHTISWGDREALATTFRALEDSGFDLAMLVLDFPIGPIPESWWSAAEAFSASSDGPTRLIVSTLPETMPENAQRRIRTMGAIPMLGLVETLEAIGVLGRVHPAGRLADAPPPSVSTVRALDEARSKQLIAGAGIRVPDSEVTQDPRSTVIGYPITVKSLGIAHKAAVGAVRVGITDETDLTQALASMPRTDRYLVEATIDDVRAEVLVSVRAARLGWLLTLGRGGIDVETHLDATHVLLPADPPRLACALESLRTAEVWRERQADLGSIIGVIDTLRSLVGENPEIVEIEINPLAVLDQGAVALDALVSVR